MANLCVRQESAQSTTAEINIQLEEGGSGWEHEFIDVVEKDFECVVCLLPLKHPWLTKCGHNMCKACLDKILLQRNPFCPEDRTPISRDDIFPDMKCHRKIMSLKVKCQYSEMDPYACKWTGELNDLVKKHQDACDSEEILCPQENCNEKLKRSIFKSHVDEQCLWREIKCPFCLALIFACKLKDHEDIDCQEISIFCSNNCGEQMARKLLDLHLQNNCPNRLVRCPFLSDGCEEEMVAKAVQMHVNRSVGEHLIIMYNTTKIQREEISMLKETILEQDKQVVVIREELKQSNQEIAMLKETILEQEKQFPVLREELKQSNQAIAMLKDGIPFQGHEILVIKSIVDEKIEIQRQQEIKRQKKIEKQQEIERKNEIATQEAEEMVRRFMGKFNKKY